MPTFEERFEPALGILPTPTFDERFPQPDEVMPQGTHPLLGPGAYSVPPAAPRLPPVAPTTAAPDAVPAIRARTPSKVTVHPAYHWGEWQRMQNQPPGSPIPLPRPRPATTTAATTAATPAATPADDPGEFFHRFLNDPAISRHLPPFMRGIGDVRTPADAFKFFTGILDNPEIAKNLPPFFRGADSPFRSILGFIGRQNGWPIDGNNVPASAAPGSQSGVGGGRGNRRGRAAGSDLPATGVPSEEAGLAPSTDPLDPNMLAGKGNPVESTFDPNLPAEPDFGHLPRVVPAPGSGASTAPGVPAGSPDGNTPTTPSTADGSTPDVATPGSVQGDPVPTNFPMENDPTGQYFDPSRPAVRSPPSNAPVPGEGRPSQGWPDADLGPGLGPMDPSGRPTAPSRRTSGALPSISRDRDRQAGGISPRLAQFVRDKEKFVPKAYSDYKQYSVGYGTRARSPNERIDKAEAERRLNVELTKAQSAVNRILPANAPPNVRDALTSFSFNVGTGWTGRSALAQAVRSGDWRLAAMLMQRYNHAGGRVNPGLVRRRREEAAMLLG